MDFKGNTVANGISRKHANPLATLTIFISQRMFKFHQCNSACLSSLKGYYLHKEHLIDCLYLVSNMQWESTIGLSVGNWHDRSRTIANRWHHFQKKIDMTILPLFLTTYFRLNSSKLSPTRHRTKNRIILANNWCIIEVSMATTGPDMTFLFVYFGVKHTVKKEHVLMILHSHNESSAK